MSYKQTDRINLKGELVQNHKDDTDRNVYIHFTDVNEIMSMNEILKDFVGKEVKITIVHDKKIFE